MKFVFTYIEPIIKADIWQNQLYSDPMNLKCEIISTAIDLELWKSKRCIFIDKILHFLQFYGKM